MDESLPMIIVFDWRHWRLSEYLSSDCIWCGCCLTGNISLSSLYLQSTKFGRMLIRSPTARISDGSSGATGLVDRSCYSCIIFRYSHGKCDCACLYSFPSWVVVEEGRGFAIHALGTRGPVPTTVYQNCFLFSFCPCNKNVLLLLPCDNITWLVKFLPGELQGIGFLLM